MNNAFFFDSMETTPVPPEEVRIINVSADPYPDGQRVRIAVEMMPFQKRPWLELTLFDAQGDEIATADVIEPLNYKIELTMHVRKAEPAGRYTFVVRLYYPEQADNDRKEVSFEIRVDEDFR
jgi:hypothetical protein